MVQAPAIRTNSITTKLQQLRATRAVTTCDRRMSSLVMAGKDTPLVIKEGHCLI